MYNIIFQLYTGRLKWGIRTEGSPYVIYRIAIQEHIIEFLLSGKRKNKWRKKKKSLV